MNTEDEEAALLTAVAADPEDDTVRLVYADWLDEQPHRSPCPDCGGGRSGAWCFQITDDGACAKCGRRGISGDGLVEDHSKAERAEFIRLQIELERPDIVCRAARAWKECASVTCPRCTKQSRSATLLSRNRFNWETDGRGVKVLESVLVRWRRGFVYELECTRDTFEFNHHAAAKSWLRRWPTVQRIRQLDRTPGEDAGSIHGDHKGEDVYEWWDDEGFTEIYNDLHGDVPRLLFHLMTEAHPEKLVIGHTREIIEFTTPEAAVDALSVASARLIRRLITMEPE